MQPYPLLQTKLHIPPIRPELVSRPRLIERLNAGLNRKLTLISAPAGFGKTTLVTQLLQSVQCHSAWLSLDEGDSDPARFLAYMIAALRTLVLSLFSTPERFQLVDEALERFKWLENSAVSLGYGTSFGLEGRKCCSESLKPIGFRQVLNLG